MTAAPASATGRVLPRPVLFGLLFFEAIIFVLQVTVNKIAAEAGLPAVGYSFWYAFGAGLILLVVCLIRRDLPPLKLRYVRNYFIMGFFGFALPLGLLAFVAPKLPASIVTMLIVLSPLLTYLFSLIARLETFRALSVLGILLGLAGVLLLLLPSASLPSTDMVGWVLLCMLAPASLAAINVLAVVLRPPAMSSVALSTALLFAAALILLPVALGLGQFYVFPGENLDGDLAILYAVLINVPIWVVFMEVTRQAGPVFFAQFNYIVVLVGFGFGVLMFGERPSGYIWGATVLMLAGLACLNWRTKPKTAAA